MALKGNLRDFSLIQLLNLVNLAHKSGVLVIEGQSDEVKIYFKDGRAKLEIALARGKKEYDKRESLKRKEETREMERLRKHHKTS